jgi:dipeptidyl-peptidase-4
MKTVVIYLFISMFVATTVNAQEKHLTLDDLLPGGHSYSHFTPHTDYKIRWEVDRLVFSNEGGEWIVDPESIDKKEPFIAKRGKVNSKSSRDNADVCSQNNQIAFTVRNGLYIMPDEAQPDEQPVIIAEDSNPYIVYGQAVHRNEFGIDKGTFWSPQGNYLAFYRMDESMVGDYPLVDISTREARLKNIKYPMAGMNSHHVKVGVYSLQSGKTVYLQTGEPDDHYLTNISWDPSEMYIYIAEVNRKQNHLQLNKYSVETGKKELILFEERNEKYVEPLNPLLFFRKTPDRFIWQSKRDGYNQLYLYNTDGKLLKQITSDQGDVTGVLGMDADEKNIFIVSNEANPVEFQVYKIDCESGKKIQLTFEPGVHNPQLNASGSYILDKYSNLTTPLNIDLIATGNGRIQRLQTAEDPYVGYTMPEITLGTIKSADGKDDLYYRLTKPFPFDPAKKYPVVVYVYGGPHSQMIVNSWQGNVRGWDIYMAGKGYIVFSLDNRGTANRGLAFENVIHRNLGINEIADQMEGIKYLRSLSYVDADRIGVHGWSYGGFLTTNLMLRYPEVFKVGVAGGPVIDWKYYEIMYGERYMDNPEDNPEGYEEANMNRLAGNLRGRFLLIHGDEDPTVVWQNSLSFLKASINAGTYPDYFVYPGQEHNMKGQSRVHLYEKITRYFEDFLK